MNLSHPLDLMSRPLDGRILEVMSGADAAFTGRQVHALLGEHSASGVQAGLNRLWHQGIITAEPAGRAILYRLNADHLAAAYVRGMAQLKHELLRRLRSELAGWEPRPASAYLFGSTARRDSTAESDIDLCLIRPRAIGDADDPAWRRQVDALARSVTAWTGNDARVVEFGEAELDSLVGRDPLLVSMRDEAIHLAGDEQALERADRRR